MYYFTHGCESSGVILVDQNGMFTDDIDDDDGFGIKIDVIKVRIASKFKSE